MKRFGIIIFIGAVVLGLLFANLLSWGRLGSRLVNISINDRVHGSGHVVTEDRDVSGFTAVEAGGIFQVEIVAQKDFSVVVEADDNLVPLIRTEVSGDVLVISAHKNFKSSSPIKVRISAPDIERVQTSGAMRMSVAGLANSSFRVEASGASKVAVNGTTEALSVDVSGASTLDAGGLQAERAEVEASGASSVHVNAVTGLNADASGASKIVYSGSPSEFIKHSSGASSIRQE